MGRKVCYAEDCDEPLPKGHRKWCSETCRQRIAHRKIRQRKTLDAGGKLTKAAKPTEGGWSPEFKDQADSKDGRGSFRRGPKYQKFIRTEWPELIASGQATNAEAAEGLDESQANVSRWMASWAHDRRQGLLTEEHEPDLSHTDDLGSFTRRYFPKLLVPDFHLDWEADIDAVVGTGERLLLLAPQRFGKTEMLIRYCLRRIAQDPNISIGWVSKTQGLAERMVGYVRQNLEHNEAFIQDIIGPGETFVPANRSGYSWTNGEFTVATRTEIRKSPTMEALGVGGTIVGKDFDLIILDDPQDRARCLSPTQREKDAEWLFTDFLSRKEEHTGVAFIMSRQHTDDLPGRIIRDHGEDWIVRIDRAHDPACTVPDDDIDAHDRCLLWMEKRSWGWLLRQKKANPAHFQRNYQNDPKTDATTYLTAKDIDELKDANTEAGYFPPGSRLVAGIDPAASKPVAAVLWAFTRDGKRVLVDAKLATAGTQGVKEVVTEFVATYGCRTYVVETNGYQGQIMQDEGIKAMRSQLNLRMVPTYTSRINKWDEGAGVVAMLHGLRDGEKYVLPGSGDAEVLQRLEDVYRQWLLFDPDYVGHKHAHDDLVMASWFPQGEMDQWEKAATAQVVRVKSNFGRDYGRVGVNL